MIKTNFPKVVAAQCIIHSSVSLEEEALYVKCQKRLDWTNSTVRWKDHGECKSLVQDEGTLYALCYGTQYRLEVISTISQGGLQVLCTVFRTRKILL